jgi:PAT family beta-lactamase induction signal transducer AmpG
LIVANQADQQSWLEAALVYSKPRVLAMLFLGFSAGLPFLLVFSTLTAWLTELGLSRTAIGFFAWVGITYSIKVVWAPVVDHLRLPLLGALGKRRGWMILAQAGIALGLCCLVWASSVQSLLGIALAALLVAFSSATQDVVIDAYRIEAVIDRFQGAMAAMYILGYRLALLVAGAGALYLAEFHSWSMAYYAMASLMAVGMVTAFLIAEPDHPASGLADLPWRRKLKTAVVEPFSEFFRRSGSLAMVILAFIALYRLSDIVMGIMANPFYLDLGYTKQEIASIAKVFGFFMTILGSFLCGIFVARWGLFRPLLLGAVMVAVTNLLFAWLSTQEATINGLILVISADNLSAGISTTAFVAYLSNLTHRSYTATQYALFSSLMTLPGKFVSGFSGVVVDGLGYMHFFVIAALLGLPAIALVMWLSRQQGS